MGKALTIIAGILCLLGSFVFAWFGGGTIVNNGMGIINIVQVFDFFTTGVEPIVWVGYIIALLTALSGIFILIGCKTRVVPIIFGLITFVYMLLIILALNELITGTLVDLAACSEFLYIEKIGGVFPILLEIQEEVGLGAYLLCAGGLLGVIGGIVNKKK